MTPGRHDSQAYLPTSFTNTHPESWVTRIVPCTFSITCSTCPSTSPTRIHIRPPSASCSKSGGGPPRPPQRAVGGPHPHVAVAEPFQRLARPARQPRDALHRAHPPGQLREHRGLVAAAGAHLQHL